VSNADPVAARTSSWRADRIAGDFPMLARRVRGHRLAYLDNAATALRPQAVVDAITEYYRDLSANVSRGVHTVSQEATERFERVRESVARFLGADADEIVFTGGTTASINLVAQSYGGSVLRPGDEILEPGAVASDRRADRGSGSGHPGD
jgi:cysteine desulfurase / selenocysteine lyase